MDFEIRKMVEADREEVASMMKVFYASEAVLTNGSDEIFENDITACVGSSPYAEGYVFVSDGERVGYAMLARSYSTEFGKPCIWLEDIYVRETFRGAGIGKAFFEMLFSSYPDAVVRLEAEKENERAINLYEKCGFEELPYFELIKK